MNKEQIIEKILEAIGGHQFEQWYNPGGRFDAFISGDTDAPSQDQIKADIIRIFHLN